MTPIEQCAKRAGLACFVISMHFCVASTAGGQPVLSTAYPAAAPQSSNGPVSSVIALSNIASVLQNPGPLFKWGPVSVRPSVGYSILYSDGILRVPGEPENTILQSFAPAILFEIGRHWTVDYSLTHTWYSSRLLETTTGQSVNIGGHYAFDDLTVGVSQSLQSSSPTLVETAQQTDERSGSTGVNLGYELGQRTRIEVSANRDVRYADPTSAGTTWTGSDWVQWSFSTWLHYRLSPRTNIGAGLRSGYDEIEAGSDMKSTQPQVRIAWRPSAKLDFNAETGLERRRFDRTSSGTLNTPTYTVGANYRPVQTTSVGVSGTRSVAASYFSDQITRTARLNVTIEQRLLQRLFLTATVNSGTTTYVAPSDVFVSTRHDRYRSFSFSVSTAVLGRGSVSVFFERSRNDSDADGFGFGSRQVGGRFNYRF